MSDLYAQDFVGWTEQQARLLREAAGRGTNLALDWSHLAEEIEDLGRSQYHAIASQVRRIMLHLLTLECSAASPPRAGWLATVADARAEIEALLERDPGLRPRLAGIIAEETPRAVKLAAAALHAHGEDAAGALASRRGGTAYTQEQILGDWLPGR